jgi:Mg/Co/Ni transporter MgtE
LNNETLINWKYVHAIPDKNLQSHIKLNLSNNQLNNIHPADLADILEDLDSNQLFKKLGTQRAAQTLTEIESDYQANILKGETPEKVANIIKSLGTDEAADILNELSEEKADEIISNLNDNDLQEDLHELLEYKADTAGGLMSTRTLIVQANQTKSDILIMIKDHYQSYDSIYDIFIVNEKNILLGTCSLKNLLIQNNNIPIKDFMEVKEKVISFPPHTPWKVLAKHMSKYNTINIPITNKKRKLLGLVSVDDILPWLIN